MALARPVVLGLPRGGVPVAARVAARLDAPLGIVAVRKLGVPGQPELAFGAIAEGGAKVINEDIVAATRLRIPDMARVEEREKREMERRLKEYIGGRPRPILAGASVVLVDDGLATGATMRAAIASVKAGNPARLSVAVPVASPRTLRQLATLVDDVVAVEEPIDFRAVGQFYIDFRATSDQEVRDLLGAHQS